MFTNAAFTLLGESKPGISIPIGRSYLFSFVFSVLISVVCAASYSKRMFPPLFRSGQPGFGPRSFDGLAFQKYPVDFPLAQPSADNLQAICLHGAHRPHYPDSYFPNSSFSHQRRRASAVNKAESWFSSCCQKNETWGSEVTLCCATQAVSFHNMK